MFPHFIAPLECGCGLAERSPREQGTEGVQETGDIRGGEGGEKYYLNYVPINVKALAGEGGSAGKGWRFDEGAKLLVNFPRVG